MLRYLKEFEAADRLEKAIAAVISEGQKVTYDMKLDKSGGVGTSQVAEAVIAKLLSGNQVRGEALDV
jgi:isocitrate dehydrogenase (NAD+)